MSLFWKLILLILVFSLFLYVGLLGLGVIAYERSKSARDNFDKFLDQFYLNPRYLSGNRKKLYWQNVSLSLNQTCLNERLLPNYTPTHTHTHTHTHTYIYTHIYIYIYIYIYMYVFACVRVCIMIKPTVCFESLCFEIENRNLRQEMYFIIFTNPSAWAGYDTRSILKRSLTGLSSEFSFS